MKHTNEISRLYHKDVYMPKQVKNLIDCKVTFDVVSKHAQEQSKLDRFGRISIPCGIRFNGSDVIEFEKSESFVKFVVRLKNDGSNFDSIYVVLIRDNKTILKTVWLNHKKDCHVTLNRSKYYNPNR